MKPFRQVLEERGIGGQGDEAAETETTFFLVSDFDLIPSSKSADMIAKQCLALPQQNGS